MKNPWRELSKVNPQKEDGHREINNDIYHALMAARLPGAVYQIVLTVIDKTWGFTKPGAPISLAQFQRMTGLSHNGVCSAIKQAEQLRLIVVARTSTKVSEYMFNKHYDTWLACQAEGTSEEKQLVKQGVQDLSSRGYKTSQAEGTSTSQVATPGTEPVKKLIKETIKETSKESKPKKKKYGEFNNVLLTDEECQKLNAKFGVDVSDKIEALSSGIESKGYKYRSHYAAILSWERREQRQKKERGGKDGTHQRGPRQLIPREQYTSPEDF